MTNETDKLLSAADETPAARAPTVRVSLLGAVLFVLVFPPFLYSCFYSLWVLVFGDSRTRLMGPLALFLAAVLSGVSVYGYARLEHRLRLLAWPRALLEAWGLSAIIYLVAAFLDGYLGM